MRVRNGLIVAVVTVPLVVTSCSGNGQSGSSGGSTPSTAAVAMPTASPGQTVDKNAFIEALNTAQKNAKTAAINMTMDVKSKTTSGLVKMDGVMDMGDGGAPKLKMTMTVPGSSSPVEMIMANQNVYMKMPQAGEKWMQMRLEDLTKATGQDLSSLMDPTKQLETQKAAIKQIKYVGDEDVNGTKTKHYQAIMDGQAAMQMSGQSLPPSVKASVSLPNNIPYDLWVDDKGLTRKMKMDLNLGSDVSMKMDGTIDKYGEPVSIEAPPSNQVTSVPVPSGSAASPSSR